MNFLNALATMPPRLLDKYRAENRDYERDIPALRESAECAWRKEPELKALKDDLIKLDREIQLSLKPIEQTEGQPQEHTSSEQYAQEQTRQEAPRTQRMTGKSSEEKESPDKSSVGEDPSVDLPGTANRQPIPLPEELRRIQEVMSDRLVIASPSRPINNPVNAGNIQQ